MWLAREAKQALSANLQPHDRSQDGLQKAAQRCSRTRKNGDNYSEPEGSSCQSRLQQPPGGYINAHILKLAHQRGYTLIGTCRERMNRPVKMSLPAIVNRVNVRRHFSLSVLDSATRGSSVFYACRMARSLALAVPKKFA
jgi:hypothetical protein